MGLPPACQLSPSKCSNPVIVNCKTSFSCVVEALFDLQASTSETFVFMTKARDCARWLTAAWQQVSLSSRTFCPMCLRPIRQNHHRIESRTPPKPMCGPLAHACMCVLAVLLRRGQCRHLNRGCRPHTSWNPMVLGAVRRRVSICVRPSLKVLRSEVVVRSASAQRVVTAFGAGHSSRVCTGPHSCGGVPMTLVAIIPSWACDVE